MYLNIKIKEDFRTLKKDTEYKFDFTNQDRYLIVGPNGCGKWVQENWNEKCLLILDEADKGFDLRYQVGLHNMLINIPAKSNVKFLVVSHTLIPILLEDKVYAFQYRRMLSPSTYIFVETGYDIKIDKDERTEV